MKLSKTQWIIVAVIVAVIVWYFFLRKKEDTKESGFNIRGINKNQIRPCDLIQKASVLVTSINPRTNTPVTSRAPYFEISHLYIPVSCVDNVIVNRQGVEQKQFVVTYKLLKENLYNNKSIPVNYIPPQKTMVGRYNYGTPNGSVTIKEIKMCLKQR